MPEFVPGTAPDPGRDLPAAWRARRPAADVVHLDSGSAGRSSQATLDAVVGHLHDESRLGAYAAQAAATDAVERTRAGLARLLGTDPAGVAFTESATASLQVLLGAWPLRPGARVGLPPASWSPNVAVLRHAGLEVAPLAVDDDGVVDLDALGAGLARESFDLLLLDQVASHRGLVQPVAEVQAVARRHDVPVWVDVAQALGHVDTTLGASGGADAVVATSRKWLTGPRGVGVLAVAEPWRARLRTWRHPGDPAPSEVPAPVASLESREAFVGGRVGLGEAVAELEADGPERVHARLVEVGERVRTAAEGLDGWTVVRPGAPAASITALAPARGQDVGAVREALLHDHGLLTAASLPWRAPEDLHAVPALRVSAHVDLADVDLELLLVALHEHRR